MTMTTVLQREVKFEAAHYLPRVPTGHKCARMHGHSYVVNVAIVGVVQPSSGWVMDFAEIDAVVGPIVRALDHRVLNELPGLENPTSERLAGWLWEQLKAGLPGLVEIAVSETRSSRCIYRGD